MSSKELRDEQRLTILKHLATGKNLDVVATITHVDKAQVTELASRHGYPDRKKLEWAADIVEKNINDARTSGLPAGTNERGESVGSRDSHAPAPRAATSSPATDPTPTTPPAPREEPSSDAGVTHIGKPDEFWILINTAKNHDRKKIQNLADKILEDLAKLRGWIDEEAEAFRARQQEAAEKEAARAEVKRLEEQLATAKAKLRRTPSSSSTTEAGTQAPAANVRAWARENGHDVPATGKLSDEIRKAYDEAHTPDAAAS